MGDNGLARALSCCWQPQEDYALHEERRKRAAWTSRFRTLATSLQVQLGAKPKGLHPRDQIFDCVLHLYAHEDVDEVIKRLYMLYDSSPTIQAFYVPQLANFLLHGELEQPARLELFLLDKAERSLQYAHRLWFFLNAWSHGSYSSELSAPMGDKSAPSGARNALLRAAEVQGAIAAARFIAEIPALEQRRQLRYAPAGSAGGHGTVLRPLAPASHGAIVDASSRMGQPLRTSSRATTIMERSSVGVSMPPMLPASNPSSTSGHASTSASAAALVAPPRITPRLAQALDANSMATFFRIRANLAAAASADASSSARAQQDATVAASEHPSITAVQLIVEDGGEAEVEEEPGTYGGRHLPLASPAAGARSPGMVMRSLTTPNSVKNSGPLMPAGGAASSLAYGAGGLAAFRETIDILAEFERISVRMALLPLATRNDALRSSLAAVARRYLPSRAAYVPLGNVHNRLVAVHSEHSFCFKTAKRAPFMVVLEVVDYGNASGRPLDMDDSEDEDDARERARRRREGREFSDQKMRRAARKARMEDLRARAKQLRGPGGAAAAGEAAVRLVAEGVRDAADRMGEVGREIGERMQERAQALKTFVLRKVDQLTLEPGEQGQQGAEALAGRRGGKSGSRHPRAAITGVGTIVSDSDEGSGEGTGTSGRVVKNAMRVGRGASSGSTSMPGSRAGSGAVMYGGRGGGQSAASRRALDAVSDGDYAAFGIESEGEDLDEQGFHAPETDHEVMSAPAAVGPFADRRVRVTARAPQGRGARSTWRRRTSSAHSDGSIVDDADAQRLIAGEEARLRLQRLVRKLRHKKAAGAGAGGLSLPLDSFSDAAATALGMSDGEEEEEVNGLLSAAAVLGRDITAMGTRAINQSVRFTPTLRNMGRNAQDTRARTFRTTLASDADREQATIADSTRNAADQDGVYVNVEGEGGGDGPAARIGRILRAGADAVLELPPSSSAPWAEAEGYESMAGGQEGAAGAPLPHTARPPLPPASAHMGPGMPGLEEEGEGQVSAPHVTEAQRTEMLARMGQWASGAAHPHTRTGSRIPSGPSLEPPPSPFSDSRVPTAGSLTSPSPASPLLGRPGEAVEGVGSARVGVAPLMVDAELEMETTSGLPDFDAVRYELDPDAPGPADHVHARTGGGSREVRAASNPLAAAGGCKPASASREQDHEEGSGTEGDDADIGRPMTEIGPDSLAVITASGCIGAGVGREGEGQTGQTSDSKSSEREVAVVFPERWREKEARIADTSPFSHLPGWRLLPVIVKANDDLRQEQFVSQLLGQFNHIWRDARVPVWLKPYDILATSPSAGIIGAVPDTISLDSLKRGDPSFTTLDDWFERHFNWGPRGIERARVARMNFARSLAAYSIVCYLLQVKDRHNGNILIDRRGHVLHIDFGFLLTNSPGGNIGFEAAPFKLTQEFVAVMGGHRSPLFATFRKLCVRAFLAVRKHRQRIILLVQMMLSGNEHLPCFVQGPRAVMTGLRQRFAESATERQCVALVHSLVDASMDNWRTRWYDAYQRWAQNIMA